MVAVSVLLDPTSGAPATAANPFPVKAASTDTALAQILALTPGFGAAGSPSDHVVSVQGHAGGTAVPISATSLPLPSGAATEATLSAAKTGLDTLHADLGTTNTTLSAVNAKLAGTLTVSGAVSAGQSGAWLVGVKGADGVGIASTSNRAPVDGGADFAQITCAPLSSTGVIFSIDVSTVLPGAAAVLMQVVSNPSANTITFKGSNDGANWSAIQYVTLIGNASTNPGQSFAQATAGYAVMAPVHMQYLRAEVTTYVGGTTTVTAVLRRGVNAFQPKGYISPTDGSNTPFISVSNTLNTAGPGVQAAGMVGQLDDVTPQAITENAFGNLRIASDRALYAGGRYQATPGTLSDGQTQGLLLSSKGLLGVYLADAGGQALQVQTQPNADGQGANSSLYVVNKSQVFNGATWDRLYSAAAASGTTGLGIPSAGVMGQWLSTKVSLTTGQFAPAQMTPRGSLRMALAEEANSDNIARIANGASDGTATGDYGLNAQARNFVFNGTGWDRIYSLGATGTAATGVQAVGPVGQFNSTLPTLTTGQYGGLQLTSRGELRTCLTAPAVNGADGLSNSAMVAAFVSGSGNASALWTAGFTFNGTSWDRVRSAAAGMNSTGAGIAAAGLVAQLDDTTPSAVTEDQFGNLRMSSDRGLLTAAIVDTTLPTLSAGATTALKANVKGAQYVAILDANGTAASVQGNGGGDGITNAFGASLTAFAANRVFNGTSWDRQRGDATGTWNTIRDAAGNARGANVTAANALVVDGSAVTQPVSATSLPLPTGAATAARQPALGVAGTPSADVLTVQGKAGMTALAVDGSAVTQPVSAAALPLPTGAATAANQTTIAGKLDTLHTDGAPVSGVATMTPDVATTAGRGVQIICTVAGNVSLTFTDASVQVIPVAVGLTRLPDAVTTLNSAGTTATVTCQILK